MSLLAPLKCTGIEIFKSNSQERDAGVSSHKELNFITILCGFQGKLNL